MRALFPSAVLLAVVACSSTTTTVSSPADPTDDGGTGDDGTSGDDAAATNDAGHKGDGSGGGDGGCESLANTGTMVTAHADNQHPLPATSGGSIVDGTYVVTAIDEYELDSSGKDIWIGCGAGLRDKQATYRFTAGAFELVEKVETDPPSASGGTFSVSGTTLVFDATCPSTSSFGWPFTATGSKILLFGSTWKDSNGTCGPIVYELTRQP